MPALPTRPSREHLRKQAKRIAKDRGLALADAQRGLANDYDFSSWAALMRHVDDRSRVANSSAVPPLFAAVRSGDNENVRRLLATGINPRLSDGRELPLHAAVRYGSAIMVETLLAGGALEWQTDREGRTPLDVARRSRRKERAGIITLLDRGAVTDPAFRDAIDAIHAGDVTRLERLIDDDPRLLRDRIVGPDAYRRRKRADYFGDPKVFWFIANNPALVDRVPANIVDIAGAMIDRGVDAADLSYTLMLVMTSLSARESSVQAALIGRLLDAGATASRETILSTGAHRECDALRTLLGRGFPLDASIAAALGDEATLRTRLTHASGHDVNEAFALAVINGHRGAARVALDAGADVDAYFPVHAHMTALHQAAQDDDVAMIDLLTARGADAATRDKLFDGTPLDWARYFSRAAAIARLERP